MTDAHILTLLAVAARRSCYSGSALCTCEDVTNLWSRVYPSLVNRPLGVDDEAYAARILAGGEEDPDE